MKRVLLPMATAILFAVAAFAQTSSQGTTSNPNSSPTMQEQQQGQMGNNGSMGNAEKPAMKHHNKMEGCVQQENGQYVLETRHGKQIPLTGQDVASHVGQTVRVMGTWAHNGAMSGSENGATSSNSGESAFDVSSVHMISQTCKMEHKSGTGNGSATQPQ